MSSHTCATENSTVNQITGMQATQTSSTFFQLDNNPALLHCLIFIFAIVNLVSNLNLTVMKVNLSELVSFLDRIMHMFG